MARNMLKLRERSIDELNTEVRELREQLFKLRWQAAGGQADNPRKIREVRREIARNLTVLQQRRATGAEA
jgi:large subunit ribosomal protein L29